MPNKSDDEFISEIKSTIQTTSESISKKVNASALSFMIKKGWVNPDNESEMKAFFNQKIPSVLSNELANQLNKVLGLDLKL